MKTNLVQPVRFGDPLIKQSDPFSNYRRMIIDSTLISRKFPDINASTIDYLQYIQQFIPSELISKQNFNEITSITNILSGNLSSFLIFESHLGSSDARADFSFAVSSMNGERERLKKLFEDKSILNNDYDISEWRQIKKFVDVWNSSESNLNDKILGTWFEFDTSDSLKNHIIPSIFISPLPIYAGFKNNKQNWLFNKAIPLLNGCELPIKSKNKIINCINLLPEGSSIFQIGTMISRKNRYIRLVIKRIKISQIIPYLKSIGWSGDFNKLKSFLFDLGKLVSRIVLHIGVGEEIESEIGIECSFHPDKYHKEEKWYELLNYLRKKGLCHPVKQNALIKYIGIGKIDENYNFDTNNCIPSVMIKNSDLKRALIRYISHIKINFNSKGAVEAKAYAALRHFGCVSDSIEQKTQIQFVN